MPYSSKGTIWFPKIVHPSPCKVVTNSYLKHTKHGVIRVITTKPISEGERPEIAD